MTYDDLGSVGQDPRWDTFKDLHATLEAHFPLVSVLVSGASGIVITLSLQLCYSERDKGEHLWARVPLARHKSIVEASIDGCPPRSVLIGPSAKENSLISCSVLRADVVPVDESSLDQWIHPPFSGHYDGAIVTVHGMPQALTTPTQENGFGAEARATTSLMLSPSCKFVRRCDLASKVRG